MEYLISDGDLLIFVAKARNSIVTDYESMNDIVDDFLKDKQPVELLAEGTVLCDGIGIDEISVTDLFKKVHKLDKVKIYVEVSK